MNLPKGQAVGLPTAYISIMDHNVPKTGVQRSSPTLPKEQALRSGKHYSFVKVQRLGYQTHS